MDTWLQVLIAVPCALLIPFGMWKASTALTRRGFIVRPVDLMDHTMTKIEMQFAKADDETSTSPQPPSKT